MESESMHGDGMYSRRQIATNEKPHRDRLKELWKEIGREVDDWDVSQWRTVLPFEDRERLGV